jgi:hypothetical protein
VPALEAFASSDLLLFAQRVDEVFVLNLTQNFDLIIPLSFDDFNDCPGIQLLEFIAFV